MIEIKLDNGQIEQIERILEEFPTKLPKSLAHAINRTLEMTKTEQLRQSTAKYTVKRNKLSENIKLFRANSGNLRGEIYSSGSVIGLDHFKLTPKKRGKRKQTVRPVVKKGEGGVLPNAFIAYHDGRLGAFKRTSAKSLPIKRLKGPSAPQMLGEMTILEYLQGFAEEKFNIRFEHELGRLLK